MQIFGRNFDRDAEKFVRHIFARVDDVYLDTIRSLLKVFADFGASGDDIRRIARNDISKWAFLEGTLAEQMVPVFNVEKTDASERSTKSVMGVLSKIDNPSGGSFSINVGHMLDHNRQYPMHSGVTTAINIIEANEIDNDELLENIGENPIAHSILVPGSFLTMGSVYKNMFAKN